MSGADPLRKLRAVGSPPLTPRQLDVLAGAAAGETMDGTALRLGIARETVKRHRGDVKRRLDAWTIAHAVGIAYERGLLPTRLGERVVDGEALYSAAWLDAPSRADDAGALAARLRAS